MRQHNSIEAMSVRNKQAECVYCGRTAKLTKDHIPPRRLFGKLPAAQLITVGCCSDCNKAASKDDEYFKLNLALKNEIREEPDIREIIPSVLRSLQREQAHGLRTAFFGGVEEAEFKSADGIYVRKRATYRVDLERMSRVPDRVVRGLFSLHYGRRLPNEYGVRTLATEGLPRGMPGRS
jgi:hypothetical protein